MKYCENLTKTHSQSVAYPAILIELNKLLKSEGCKLNPSPFDSIDSIVINGDELEKLLTYSMGKTDYDKNKSVDLIFGVKSDDDSSKEFQLVELKLNSTTFYHLNKMSFRDKVQCSVNAMGTSTSFAKKCYVIFQTNALNEGIRFLFRQQPVLDRDFKATDVVGLHKLFFAK